MHLATAAFAYYTLAVTAYSLLIYYAFGAPDGAPLLFSGINGAIDTPEEYVIVFSIVGLTLTMIDTVFSTLQLVFSSDRFNIEPQAVFGNKGFLAAAQLARQAGSAGVYLATFMFATQNRSITGMIEATHGPLRAIIDAGTTTFNGIDAEEFNTYLNVSRAIPYLLAATVSVLGAVLSQPAKGKNTGYLGLTPIRDYGKSGTVGFYA